MTIYCATVEEYHNLPDRAVLNAHTIYVAGQVFKSKPSPQKTQRQKQDDIIEAKREQQRLIARDEYNKRAVEERLESIELTLDQLSRHILFLQEGRR